MGGALKAGAAGAWPRCGEFIRLDQSLLQRARTYMEFSNFNLSYL